MRTKTSYSFFELIVYLYIGKIEKARNWLQPVAGGVKAKRFTCLIPKRCKFSYFIRSLQIWRRFSSNKIIFPQVQIFDIIAFFGLFTYKKYFCINIINVLLQPVGDVLRCASV